LKSTSAQVRVIEFQPWSGLFGQFKQKPASWKNSVQDSCCQTSDNRRQFEVKCGNHGNSCQVRLL